MIIATLLWIIVLWSNQSHSKKLSLIGGIALLGILELRPYFFVVLLLYLVVLKSFRLILFFGGSLLLWEVAALYFQKSLSYQYWLLRLFERSENFESGSDQISLISLLIDIKKIPYLISFAFVSLVLIFLMAMTLQSLNKRTDSEKSLIVMTLPCVFSPFLHPHDLLLSYLALFLVMMKRYISKKSPVGISGTLALVCAILWTNSNYFLGLAVTFVFTTTLFYYFRKISSLSLMPFLIIQSSLLITTFFNEEIALSFYSIASFCAGVLIWAEVAQPSVGKLKMSVLSFPRYK